MPPSPEDLVETAGCAVCTFGRVVLLVWKQPPATDGLAEARRLFRIVRDRTPKEKFVFLTVIEAAATALNIPAEVREALAALLKEFQKHIAGAAVVVDAEGFRASLVRTFVATMNLGNRLEFPSNTERNLEAATRWLAERDAALAIDASGLADSVTRLRARWQSGGSPRDRLAR